MGRAGNLLESAQASGKVYGYPLTSSCGRVLCLLRGRKRSFCTSSLPNKTSLPIINGRRCTPALSSSNCLLHTAHSLSRGSSVKFSAACALSLPARPIVGYPYKVTGLVGCLDSLSLTCSALDCRLILKYNLLILCRILIMLLGRQFVISFSHFHNSRMLVWKCLIFVQCLIVLDLYLLLNFLIFLCSPSKILPFFCIIQQNVYIPLDR